MNFDNFNSVCRTCLKRGTLSSLFMEHKQFAIKYSEMMFICTSIQVLHDDLLPSHICKKCLTCLIAAYKFKQNAFETDTKLRQILNIAKLESSTVDNSNSSDVDYEEKTNFDVCDITNNKHKFNSEENFQSDSNETEISFKARMQHTTIVDDKTDVKETILRNDYICESIVKIEPTVMDDIKLESKTSIKKTEETGLKQLRTKHVNKRRSKFKQMTFQCDVCGKFLSCHSNLIQHMRRHTGERPFSCDLCDKKFTRSEHVTIHRRIHTGERPHSCTICMKRFVQYAALTAHLRTHSGERPHMCAICGKSFSQSVSLTYHTRTHTGETPFKCKICNKGFAHSGNLNIHMRFHKNERPYICTVCGRSFVTSSHLTVHIKQHTGDRPYKCTVCDKAFTRSEHLKDHLVIHTGQKPHACLLCPKRYTQSSHLNRHMKTHKI